MLLESLDMTVALADDCAAATRPYESDRARMAAVYSLPVRVPAATARKALLRPAREWPKS